MKRILLPCAGLVCCLLGIVAVCGAQVPMTQQPVRDQPELPAYLPEESEKTGEGLELPPAPRVPDAIAGGPAFLLRGVAFRGNTVFSDDELMEVAEPFLGREVGLADLEELRYRLTRRYTDGGYVNSGAVLEAGQRVDDGVVDFTVVEGRLSEIRVSGNGRLRPGYVTSRLWPDTEAPFNTNLLQERFLLLLQDPLIQRMDGGIRPGADPGEAVLDMNVVRERPYGLTVAGDNRRPPSTGSLGGMATAWLRNLTGYGDFLDVSYGASEGASEVDAGWSFLLNSRDTRLSARYSYSENSVVEEPLKSIDIESESESFDVTLVHPFYRTLRHNLEMGAVLSLRESKTFLLGTPFSFSAGDENGKSRVTVLRLVQSYVDRTTDHALALRSTFSIGLDLLDATVHGGGVPDGKYFAWLGQAQYAHRLGEKLGSLVLRGDAQLASDRLLTLEQFALGGATTVRGYRENELVRDNGFDVSAEWRYPLWRASSEGGSDKLLQAACFMDFGSAWNKGEDPWDNRLHSAGLGLLWESKWLDAQFYWAYDIEEAPPRQDYDLQDDGIHFRVVFHY